MEEIIAIVDRSSQNENIVNRENVCKNLDTADKIVDLFLIKNIWNKDDVGNFYLKKRQLLLQRFVDNKSCKSGAIIKGSLLPKIETVKNNSKKLKFKINQIEKFGEFSLFQQDKNFLKNNFIYKDDCKYVFELFNFEKNEKDINFEKNEMIKVSEVSWVDFEEFKKLILNRNLFLNEEWKTYDALIKHIDFFDVIRVLVKTLNPDSIFLYGSNVSGDTNSESDFEIGLIFDTGQNGENENNYKSRKEIQEKIKKHCSNLTYKFSIFPFRLKELIDYKVNIPFQRNIFIKTLIDGGAKTIMRLQIIEKLNPPKVTIKDFIEDTIFNLGFAFAASQIAKTGNLKIADNFFYRSCLFGTRNLIWLKTGKLIIGFNNIYKTSFKINLPKEYQELVKKAIDIRNGKQIKSDVNLYYKNISYFNKFILEELKREKEIDC